MNESMNGEIGWLIFAAMCLGIVWLISALLVAGWHFAYMQSSFPRIADRDRGEDLFCAVMFGMLFGALGPIGVLLGWLLSGFAEHGWRLWRKTPNDNMQQARTAMQVKINPSQDETGSGLSAFASWESPDLHRALELLFNINRKREQIDTVEVTPDGIAVRLSYRPLPGSTSCLGYPSTNSKSDDPVNRAAERDLNFQGRL